jgi:hypothetical protein
MAIDIKRKVKLGKAGIAFHFDLRPDAELDRALYEEGVEHERASHDADTFAGRVFANLSGESDSPAAVSNGHEEESPRD